MNQLAKVSLLLFFFALCAAAALITHATRQRTPAPSAHELYSVVNLQLSAFRRADFDSAYQNAAAAVQEKFSRSQFELMIQRDFCPMTRAQHVEFGAVEVTGGSAMVQVFLTTPDGATRAFLYSFSAEREGWKIDGVQPLGPQPLRRIPGLHI
jgi:hypothetical protein